MDDLKIRQKCEDMLVYGYTAIRQFPKTERHVLAQELRLTMCRQRYPPRPAIVPALAL